jgi:hypothetical protein
VQDPILNSGWDTFAVAIPFVLLLAVGIFRLDSIFASPRCSAGPADRLGGTNEAGEPVLCDPDGRRSNDPAFHRLSKMVRPQDAAKS